MVEESGVATFVQLSRWVGEGDCGTFWRCVVFRSEKTVKVASENWSVDGALENNAIVVPRVVCDDAGEITAVTVASKVVECKRAKR